jgi:tRNA pseudouridine55 synthase
LGAFRGQIEQVPPQFSAVKVDGERAYDIARAGEEMDLAARPLWVEQLDMIAAPMRIMSNWKWSVARAAMCGPSRATWARQLGLSGPCGVAARTWSGPFDATDGLTLDQIDALAHTPELDAHLRPLEAGLADLPELPATPEGRRGCATAIPAWC